MNIHRSRQFFRDDIQCLRGLSVLAVVLFHLPRTLLPGGYLGVDVFFVISGYVITGSIYREIQSSGRFSLTGFYKRRFNRLYPALLGVVAMTVICANYLVPLYDDDRILKTGLLSLVGLSNNFLLRSSQDYFDLATKLNPFLHTWSLGIEEQFYVGFSALISFLLWLRVQRPGINTNLLSWIATLGALSFLIFARQVLWQGAYGEAFYLLSARAWQLAAGALGCLVVTKWQPAPWQKAMAVAGLMAVFVSADQNHIAIHPQLEILFRILTGACGVLLCRPSPSLTSGFFSKLLQPIKQGFLFLGDKSYSIYLVHWPLISLGHWGYPNVVANSALVLSSSIACGWISWRLFEQGLFVRKLFIPLAIAGVAAVSTIATFTDRLPGLTPLAHRLSRETDRAWTDAQRDVEEQLGMRKCDTEVLKTWADALCKTLFKDGDPTFKHAVLYVLGDSHAGHILWGAHGYAEHFGYNLVFLPSRFPFADVTLHVDRQPPLRYFVKKLLSLKSRPPALEMVHSIVKPGDLLVFSNFTSRALSVIPSSVVFPIDVSTNEILSSEQLFKKTLNEFPKFLNALPEGIRVVLVLDNPVLRAYPGTCLIDPTRCRIRRSELESQRRQVTELYEAFAARSTKVQIIDLAPSLCSAQSCDLISPDGKYLYRDDNHLSPAGGDLFLEVASRQVEEFQ